MSLASSLRFNNHLALQFYLALSLWSKRTCRPLIKW